MLILFGWCVSGLAAAADDLVTAVVSPMVIKPAVALGASQSHEAEQFSVRPAAVHAVAFAACR